MNIEALRYQDEFLVSIEGYDLPLVVEEIHFNGSNLGDIEKMELNDYECDLELLDNPNALNIIR
jgi:hypothetical protein